MGNKQYELSNHLGNVLAVVSDRIHMESDKTWTEVISMSDYYPFGMAMGGRSESSAGYRFGFNGQEKIDEIYGPGNYIDYTFRGYNPILGRFFAVDPVDHRYPYWTPYQFAGNIPIRFLDAEGLQPGERAFRAGLIISNPRAYELEMKAQEYMRGQMANADPMETIHFAFDGLGMIPVIGEAADGVNGGLYLLEGNYIDAGLSFSGMIPVAGWFATGAKWTKNAVTYSRKYGDEAVDLVQTTLKKGDEGAKEIFTITKSGSFKDAKTVMNDLVNLGDDAKDYIGRKGPFESKVAGKVSADGKSGYRIDWDDKSGAHINWWNGKEKGAIPFTGDLEQARRIVDNTLGN